MSDLNYFDAADVAFGELVGDLTLIAEGTPIDTAQPAGTASKLDQEIRETAKLASARPSPRAISIGGAKLTSTI